MTLTKQNFKLVASINYWIYALVSSEKIFWLLKKKTTLETKYKKKEKRKKGDKMHWLKGMERTGKNNRE